MSRLKSIEKDHGWAWLICFGSFITFFLESGLVKCLGVLLPALRDEFSTQTWVIGFIISLMPGYGTVTCLLAGILRKRFSARVVVMLFGLLSAIGIVCASFTTSLSGLAISILLTGFLFGAEAVTLAILPDYFDKSFDTANVLAHLGISTGVIIMPMLTQFLHDVYGWRGALLVIGGLYFHILVSAALMRPLETNQNETERPHNVTDEQDESTELNRSLPVKHTTEQSLPDDVNRSEQSLRDKGKLYAFISALADSLDLRLFQNFKFISELSVAFGTGYYFTGWLIYLVPHSLNSGFQPYHASALGTVGGVGHVVGNIVYMLLLKVLNNKQIMYCSMITASVSLLLDPVVTVLHSYVGLMVLSFAMNLGNAAISCCVGKYLLDTVEPTAMVNAFNWSFTSYSVGAVCSGFFSGWFFDRFGNYTASFLCLGFVALFSLIPLIIIDYTNYRQYNSVPKR